MIALRSRAHGAQRLVRGMGQRLFRMLARADSSRGLWEKEKEWVTIFERALK